LVKEQIKANATDLTLFESWRFDTPPLSMNGGFERARAVFGGEAELERILSSLNSAVFGVPTGQSEGSQIQPNKPLN
jgi:type I restriction enzyme, R subunit